MFERGHHGVGLKAAEEAHARGQHTRLDARGANANPSQYGGSCCIAAQTMDIGLMLLWSAATIKPCTVR
jgi:hypothetical protein